MVLGDFIQERFRPDQVVGVKRLARFGHLHDGDLTRQLAGFFNGLPALLIRFAIRGVGRRALHIGHPSCVVRFGPSPK
jgi:hypothetical protein